MKTTLPSTLVIGVQKAGTTSLDAWLRLQSELSLPRLKETHYFSEDERHLKGLGWYYDQFEGGRKQRVEVDPDYLTSVAAPTLAAHAYAGKQSPKLIAILRSPLGRARSHWSMTCRRGLEERDFATALCESHESSEASEILSGHHDYYGRGRYAVHLRRWRDAFPRAETLLLTFEDLIRPASREATFLRICNFIGLEETPVIPDFDAIKNPAGRARSHMLNRVLHRRSGLRSAVGRLIPSQDLRLRIGVWMERLNTARAHQTTRAPESISSPVLNAMKSDVDELALFMDRDLCHWKDEIDAARTPVAAGLTKRAEVA